MAGKNIPPLPANTDRQLRTAIEKLAEATDTGAGLRGRPEDRYVRVADLLNLGLAKKLGAGAQRLVSGENLVSDNAPNLTIPPQPENLEVRGGIGIIFLTWNNARAQYANHSLTEIWRSETDDIGTALMIGQTAIGFIHADGDVDYTKTYYYWVRFVSVADVAGPWNSSVGTLGQCQQDPAELLELLSGEITKSQLHQDLLEPIDLIDAPGTGLVSQIINEANSRLALAQQMRGDYTGNNPAEISTGLLHAQRVETNDSINQLASQMALLTAGGATQFDHVDIWYFDSGVDGWTSAAASRPGWVRPDFSVNSFLVSPAVSFDGTKYTKIRARIKKIGFPIWVGNAYFSTPAFPVFESPRVVNISEPVYDDENVALITFTMNEAPNWVGSTITGVLITLAGSTDASNYFEFDWIAIGRPAPGASSAELFEEQQARIAGQNANANAITLANAQIATKASQSALDSLSSDVNEIDGIVTAQGNSITSLSSQINPSLINSNPNFAEWSGALPDGYTIWAGSDPGVVKHQGQHAYTGPNAISFTVTNANAGIRNLVTNVADSPYLDVEVIFTLISGTLSGAGIYIEWVNTVPNGYGAAGLFNSVYTDAQALGKKCVAKFRLKKLSSFSGTFGDYRIYIFPNWDGFGQGVHAKNIIVDRVAVYRSDASADAIFNLSSRVESAENSIVSQSDRTTILQNSLSVSGGNLLENDSFEIAGGEAALGWGTYNNAGVSMTMSECPGRLSGKGVKIAANAETYSTHGVYTLSNVLFKASQWYTVSFYAKKQNGANFLATYLAFNMAPAAIQELANPQLTAEWQRYAFKLTFAADYAELFISRSGHSVAGDAILFDDVMVTEGELLTGYKPKKDYSLIQDVAAQSTAVEIITSRVQEVEGQVESQAESVLQLQATMPGGGNLIATDTDFKAAGTSGWSIQYNEVAGALVEKGVNSAYGVLLPTGVNCLILRNPGYGGTGFSSTGNGILIPVEAGKRYYIGVRISSFRASSGVLVLWYNAAGAWFATTNGNLIVSNAVSSGDLNAWGVSQVFETAPAGAVGCSFLVGHTPASGLGGDPFTFFCRPMFCEVAATTTVAPPYSPSGAPATAAAIQVIAEAAATSAGQANARWEVKTTVGDLTGGVGFYNDGTITRFGIHADQFFVFAPGKNAFTFVTEGSDIVVDGAKIKTASIGSAAITDLSVTKLVGDTANFVKLNVGTLVVDDIQGDVDKTISAPVITGVPLPGGGFSPTVVLREVVTLNIPSQVRPRIPLIFSKARHSVSSTGSYLTRYMIMQPQSAGPAIAMTTPTTKSSDYLEWNILASNGGNNPPGWWGNVVNQSEVSWVAGGVNHYGNVSNKTISQDPAGPIDTMFTYRVYFNRVISRGATSGALGENYQLRLANNRVYQSVISEGQQASYLNAGQSTEVNAYLMSLSRTGGGASYTMCISGTGTLERLEFTALLVR